MNLWSFDTETSLISPGCLAPKMVCLSEAFYPKPDSYHSDIRTGLVLRQQGIEAARIKLTDPTAHLIAHNATYDFGVLAAESPSLLAPIFDAYRAGRVGCTMIRQQLIDVSLGMRYFSRVRGPDGEIIATRASYSLADLVALYFKRHLEKADTWRLRYALLDGVPIEQWPQEAVDYAISDAIEGLNVWQAQEKEIHEQWGELPNQIEQQRSAWALHLISMWGIRAEETAVDRFIATCEDEIVKMHKSIGAYEAEEREAAERDGETSMEPVFKPTGSRTISAIRDRVVASLNRLQIDVPPTPTGKVSTDKNTLQMCVDDSILAVLAESMVFARHLGQWGPVLRAAVHRPVVCRYTVCRETGRTSSSGSEGQEGTNIQNPPRKGDVRPCIVPRPGFAFVSTDADTIELRAHAQNMLDLGIRDVRLAETFIAQARGGGPDAHEVMAASLMGIDPFEVQRLVKVGDKTAEDARQFGKIPGYGFPGGLGADAFVAYAASQLNKEDFILWFSAIRPKAIVKAKGYRETWFDTFPENRDYFAIVREIMGKGRTATVRQLMSNRIRGDVRYAAVCNGFFQARVADAMKEILFDLQDESYTGRCVEQHRHGGDYCTASGRSVLYGSRFVMFLHDEPIGEHPVSSLHERAMRQRDIVVTRLNRWMPDIPCGSTAVATYKWYKGAKPVKVDDRLVPCKPEKYDDGGKSRIRWVADTQPASIHMPTIGLEAVKRNADTFESRMQRYEIAKQQAEIDTVNS